jgi:hypothetical protein
LKLSPKHQLLFRSLLSFIPPKPKEFEKAVIGIFFEEVNGATPCNGTQPFIHDCRE